MTQTGLTCVKQMWELSIWKTDVDSQIRAACFIFAASKCGHNATATQWYLTPVYPTTIIRLSCQQRQTHWHLECLMLASSGRWYTCYRPVSGQPPISVTTLFAHCSIENINHTPSFRLWRPPGRTDLSKYSTKTRLTYSVTLRFILSEQKFIMEPAEVLLFLLHLAEFFLGRSPQRGKSERGCTSSGVDPTELLATLGGLKLMSRNM